MDDREAHDFYADPANLAVSGPGRKRKGQAPRLTSMTAVRFAPEVIEAVKAQALGAGVTVGSWIRRLVDRELAARRQRPLGLVAGSSRAGEPRALPSALARPRSFRCPHMSISNVASVSCQACGPLQPVAA